jgi:hypothetical protein
MVRSKSEPRDIILLIQSLPIKWEQYFQHLHYRDLTLQDLDLNSYVKILLPAFNFNGR